MGDGKKSGKALLRAVDGRKASGVCQYTVDVKGFEATVTAQLFDSAAVPEAVLQYGAERGYLCRAPVRLGMPTRADAGVAAVWVTEGDKPVLFAQIAPGTFDMAQARKCLLEQNKPRVEFADLPVRAASAAAAVAVPLAPPPKVKPTFREPKTEDSAVPFPSAEPILLLQPGAEPAPQSAAVVLPEPAKNAVQQPQAAQAAAQPPVKAASAEPLVLRRAPRPTPRQPVYSPLWDDVSAEFEKMLGSLPPTQPFSGGSDGAHIAEMPLAGAVQCYVGSVEIKGMKVFLQAVPARPFARPAGFDHSLVSRDGESFWVKYFIQE